jgi:acetyl esterase/lipase
MLLLAWGVPAFAQQRPGGVPPQGTTVLRNLEYVKGGHERQKLDLYLPEKLEPAPLPVIVWIHGGGWQAGSKDRCPAIPFVAKGYAVASINYRLSQHATFPAQIEDCKAAIRWLRANAAKYHLDADHIGAWGASAGGHLVALLGTTGNMKQWDVGDNKDQSSRVQAVVDWFGRTDFRTVGSRADSPVTKLLGGPVAENKEKATQASPVTHVTKGDPPFLIMHGDMDPLVAASQSEELTEALKKAGVEVTLKILKGAKHGGPEFSTPESRKLIADFFDKHLKKASGK